MVWFGFGFGIGFVRFGFEKIRIRISKNIEKMDALLIMAKSCIKIGVIAANALNL